jgi:sugar-specific transcriptional regulator TrmB
MQEELAVKLEKFGFTVNQAKIYLNIVESGKTSVGRIAANTHLCRQDIYKLMPKFEKMGLITMSIDKPRMIEAVPMEKALDNLISKEKEKVNSRFSYLENNLKEIINSIQKQPVNKEETRFSLLNADEAIRNKGQLTFRKMKKECLLVTNIERIETASRHFRDLLQTTVSNKVKTRLIVVTKDDSDIVKGSIEKIAPSTGQFMAKSIKKTKYKNYQIIDNKEIWIGTQQKTESGSQCMLWTNDQNIIDIYKENFRKIWSQARTLISVSVSISSFTCFVLSFSDCFM